MVEDDDDQDDEVSSLASTATTSSFQWDGGVSDSPVDETLENDAFLGACGGAEVLRCHWPLHDFD